MLAAQPMRYACLLALALAACAALPPGPPPQGPLQGPPAQPPASDGGWDGNATFALGWRELDDEPAWRPVEEQFAIGIELDMRPEDFPLGFELGMVGSYGYEDDINLTAIDVEGSIGELYLGPRLTLELADDVLHLYGGGGVTFAWAQYEGILGSVSIQDDDATVGAYAHGGVYVAVAEQVRLGFDVRGVFATDVELFGVNTDVDYLQLAFTFGIGF
jgi:hypothetical protein